MYDLSKIKQQIENLRDKLNFLVSEKKDLTSHEIVTVSQELDKVLNQFNDNDD